MEWSKYSNHIFLDRLIGFVQQIKDECIHNWGWKSKDLISMKILVKTPNL